MNLPAPEPMTEGNLISRSRAVLIIIGLATVWLLLMAASLWSILNWTILGSILEDQIEPILPFVRTYGGIRTTVFGVDVRELIYFMVLLVTLAIVAARPARLPGRRFWLACMPLAAVLVAARLSLGWTISPDLTSSQIVPFFLFTLAALFWGAMLSEEEIWSALETIAIVAVILNLLAIVSNPNWSMSIRLGEVAWRGLFIHKNYLAPILVFANLVMLVRLAGFDQQHWIARLGRILIFGLSLWALWNTRGVGSLLLVVSLYVVYVAGLLYLKWGHRLRWRHWAVLGGTAFAAAAGLWLARAPLLAVFNRSASLSERLPLWSMLGPFVTAKLIIGYGFGRAFWELYSEQIVVGRRSWHPGHAHNGFVDFALDLGLVGALALIIFLGQSIVAALAHLSHTRTRTALWPILIIVLVLVLNLFESLLGSRNSFFWFLLVLTFSFALYQEVKSRERAPEKLPENSPAIPGAPVSPAEAGAVDTSDRSSTSDVTPEGSDATGQSWRARSYCRTAGVLLLIIGVLGWYWQGTPGILSLQQPLELRLHLVSGAIALWAGSTSTGSRFALLVVRLLGLGYTLLALIGFVHPAVPYGIYLHPGDSLIHLILGVWGLWAGFFAKAEARARSL